MKVLSNLEFKNSTYILNKFTDFPENPSEGTVIFKENRFIYLFNQHYIRSVRMIKHIRFY